MPSLPKFAFWGTVQRQWMRLPLIHVKFFLHSNALFALHSSSMHVHVFLISSSISKFPWWSFISTGSQKSTPNALRILALIVWCLSLVAWNFGLLRSVIYQLHFMIVPSFTLQGACISAPIAVSLCLWLAIGGYTITPSPTLPPAPIDGCHYSTNGLEVTNTSQHLSVRISGLNITVSSQNELHLWVLLPFLCLSKLPIHSEPLVSCRNPLESFYRISYLWYSTLGIVTTVTLGLIISFLSGNLCLICFYKWLTLYLLITTSCIVACRCH